MCDYSLCGIPNRLAVEGEDLVVYKFPTGSKGLASYKDLAFAEAGKPVPTRSIWARLKRALVGGDGPEIVAAVCIPPGAFLLLREIPEELRRQWRLDCEEGVFFVQTSANVNSYRDAIQFQDGRLIRLQDLREGLRFRVLSLAGAFISVDQPDAAMV